MKLPIGTRLQVIDNKDLLLAIGTKGTLHEVYDDNLTTSMWVMMDGDSAVCIISDHEVEVIIDGKGVVKGKKYFNDKISKEIS